MSALSESRLLDPPAVNRVLVVLSYGPATAAAIRLGTGLKASTAHMTLHRLKSKGLVRQLDRRTWALREQETTPLTWTRGI